MLLDARMTRAVSVSALSDRRLNLDYVQEAIAYACFSIRSVGSKVEHVQDATSAGNYVFQYPLCRIEG